MRRTLKNLLVIFYYVIQLITFVLCFLAFTSTMEVFPWYEPLTMGAFFALMFLTFIQFLISLIVGFFQRNSLRYNKITVISNINLCILVLIMVITMIKEALFYPLAFLGAIAECLLAVPFIITIFLFLTVGCSNRIISEGNKIVVEKRIGEADKYEYYNENKDSKEVENAKAILNKTNWENAKVSMEYPPNYKFHFEDINSKSTGMTYKLWISPNKDTIELVIDSESKYIHLSKEVSGRLFKIITGEELKGVK